jgi:hypothetical protein
VEFVRRVCSIRRLDNVSFCQFEPPTFWC